MKRRRRVEAVEALIEAGEEEGIIEESDRELVRSAVEFGDKVVREVMTPRPEIFAVPGSTTMEEFLRTIESQPYSRVPVYDGTLDHVTGIVFAHDLLHIRDEDARTRTVAEHRALGGVCAGDEEGERAAARDAAREAAYADRD